MRDLGTAYIIPQFLAEFLYYAFFANLNNSFDKGMNVLLVDIGHASFTLSVFHCERVCLFIHLHNH